MRFGLLGPAEGNLDGLAQAAAFLLNTLEVTRAVYLGADDALDITVRAWAASVVHAAPDTDAMWGRAIELSASPEARPIAEFVEAERARIRLKCLEGLAASSRAVELLSGRLAVLVHDKALLDEDDIAASSFLVYGRSDTPLIKRIGQRWFITPGKIGCAGGGAGTLEDTPDGVVATIYDSQGQVTQRESLAVSSVKIRVTGDP